MLRRDPTAQPGRSCKYRAGYKEATASVRGGVTAAFSHPHASRSTSGGRGPDDPHARRHGGSGRAPERDTDRSEREREGQNVDNNKEERQHT